MIKTKISFNSINFKKLIAFRELLNNVKKEKGNNKSDNNDNNNDNDKKTTLISSIINNTKGKINKPQEGNNNHEKVNKIEKEIDAKKAQNISNSIQNTSENYNEFNNLEQVTSIYEKYGIAPEGLNTIFIAETYLKTLPDYLPGELKRKTVLDIIRSSGMNADNLLKDGEERKEALNNFFQKFSQTSERIIKDLECEIDKLSESIQENKKAIAKRNNLQEEQTSLINYEFQRLQKIMKFLKGESN